MVSTSTHVFAVFFSVQPDNVNLPSHMRLLRKLAKFGAGSGVEMIDAVVFPTGQAYCFFALGRASNQQVVEAAVESSRRDFDVQIATVTGYTFHEATAANYCVFGFSKTEADIASARSQSVCETAIERLRVDFGSDARMRNLWLVQAPSPEIARRHAAEQQPGLYLHCTPAHNAITYADNLGSNQPAAAPKAPAATPILVDGNGGAIYNESTVAAWFSVADSSVLDPGNSALDFYNILKARREAAPAASYPVQGFVYAWNSTSGTFNYDLHYPNELGNEVSMPLQSSSTCPLPAMATPSQAGITLGFDASAGVGFHVRTELTEWLSDVVNTTKHDAAWPEDDPNWPQGLKNAYTYWLSLLSGDPRHVVIDPATVNNKFLNPGRPANADFTEDDFKTVYQHLYDECDAISKCNRWYGVAGIMNAINTNVTAAATDSLIAASNLMQIPQQTGEVMMIIGAVISDISSIVGAIPGIGNALEAGINVMWSIAATAQFGSGQASQPIQAGIADMADMLTNYRQSIEDARLKTNGAINGNYGKLMEFYKNYPDPVQTDTLPNDYIIEAGRVWKVHFYKGLFAFLHGAEAEIGFDQQAPANPWNPAAGNYNYYYVLPGRYYDSKRNLATGLVILWCWTDAPSQVMQDLFGPATAQTPAPLNINPLEFFAGFNGWPTVRPWYGNQEKSSPLVSIGF